MASLVAALVAFVCMWCVVPGLPLPTQALAGLTVALSVAAPEYAPILLVAALGFGGIAMVVAPRGRARTVIVAIVGLGVLCSCVPIAAYSLDPALPKVVSLARFLAAPSRAIDAARVHHFNVRTRDDAKVALDVYDAFAPHAAPAPAMIEIHGGAWVFGDVGSDMTHFARIARAGIVVIAADYRHAPQHRFPTQRDDVDGAIRFVADHAAALGIDRSRIVIVGRSAGAQLALLAAYRPQPIHIRGVAAFYAPTDLVMGATVPPPIDPLDIRRALTAYLGAYTPGNPIYREASPIAFATNRRVVPTFLISGARDELVAVEQQRALARVLRATPGNRVETHELPWSNHAFDDIPNGMGEQIADALLDRWLRETLGDPKR